MLAPNQLNDEYAMAVCTVIAIGHLSLTQNESPLLHEPDNVSNEDHAILMSIVMNSPVEGLRNLIPAVAEQPSKSDHPFIYASHGGVNNNRAAQDAIDLSLKPYTDSIEHYFVRLFDGQHRGFFGAYIGGIAETGIVRLYCPSLMYQYAAPAYLNSVPTNPQNPNYRNAWTEDYRNFVQTTETILDIFAEIGYPPTVGDGIYYPDPVVSRGLIRVMDENLGHNSIFGSVHGLVTSMTENFQNAPGHFNIELALSAGTNKVASCLPCAIFARSQGAPASYTHLGRGDYWNLPQNITAGMRNNWEEYVIQCYGEGMRIFGAPLKALSNDYDNFFNALENDNIPGVFLSSLMFPGSFVRKMNAVFRQFREL